MLEVSRFFSLLPKREEQTNTGGSRVRVQSYRLCFWDDEEPYSKSIFYFRLLLLGEGRPLKMKERREGEVEVREEKDKELIWTTPHLPSVRLYVLLLM